MTAVGSDAAAMTTLSAGGKWEVLPNAGHVV